MDLEMELLKLQTEHEQIESAIAALRRLQEMQTPQADDSAAGNRSARAGGRRGGHWPTACHVRQWKTLRKG